MKNVENKVAAGVMVWIGAFVIATGAKLPIPESFATPHEAVRAPQPELGPYMERLQRYSQKLGLSIYAENAELSRFYLDETEETLEAASTNVPVLDEIPVASTMHTIMFEPLRDLELALTAEKVDWVATQDRYRQVIDGCNRCHAALEHQFIRILPADRSLQFNQDFSARP